MDFESEKIFAHLDENNIIAQYLSRRAINIQSPFGVDYSAPEHTAFPICGIDSQLGLPG